MSLNMELSQIKYTTKQFELFTKLNVKTINDVLSFYPARYIHLFATELNDGDVVVEANITSKAKIVFFQGKKSRIFFDVLVGNENINVSIFNRNFLLKPVQDASTITIIGKYDAHKKSIVASDIKFKPLEEIKGIYPVYHLKNTYRNNDYYKIVSYLIKTYANEIKDVIPNDLLNKYRLLRRSDAIKMIHFPKTSEELISASRTLIFEEFFVYAIASLLKKQAYLLVDSSKDIDTGMISNLVSEIGYELTNDQKKVLNEIYLNLKSPELMNRLLLADVGSGKTLVALISAYLVYLSGYQCAFMAPTSLLAMQHFQSASSLFSDIEFNIVLLTGATNQLERSHMLEDLRNGKIDLLIGTHALIQDDVIFKQLGLAIFDEQQRFGVSQRQALLKKGEVVESLMLSATPIPRTLAQVLYANISVSYMKESLPFKKPIITHYYQSATIKPFYDQMLDFLKSGMQIYVVTPLVEESESIDSKNVLDVYDKISKHFASEFKVGLMHGKMASDEKDNIMAQFVENEIQILVATSLIEVGISVDNANCIIIYDAHRFGLSQLHQLRGRVGRGQTQGHAVLLSNSKQPESIEKLEYISKTNDGFAIAEYDLSVRGPGDLLGIRQSGMPSFNLANMIRDEKIYQVALNEAQSFINNESEFKQWLIENKSIIENNEGSDL